jgi:alpha-galactosidase
MKSSWLAGTLSSCVLFVGAGRASAPPSAAEMADKARWTAEHLGTSGAPVFAFKFGGSPVATLLKNWTHAPATTAALPGGRTRREERWLDPKSGLEVRLVSVEYSDYPAVEWTAYLANRGQQESPLIESLEAIDAPLPAAASGVTLRTIRGDNYSASSYEPFAFPLAAGPRHFEPVKGRSTNGAWPYFNLDGGTHGVIVALGWPGQWEADFTPANGVVRVVGGQQITRFRLHPGEEVRTPLVALLFWQRPDWIEAQNLWRRWYLAHNAPRPGGQLPPAQTAICVAEDGTARGAIASLEDYLAHGVRANYYWMDAGWYQLDDPTYVIDAAGIGSWVPDPKRFPHGIREVVDAVHSHGMKFILWFEPERACHGSDLWEHHQDWLLPWEPENREYAHIKALDLGNPAARRWAIDLISQFIIRDHIDVFRQDGNANPLGAWKTADGPDRQGITENFYVQGFLEFWDTLLREHPGLMIDSCGSGGRRNDLETMRRSVPLLRSDYQAPALPEGGPKGTVTTDIFDGNQGHGYGLSLWLPFYGTGDAADDWYSARSHISPFNVVGTSAKHPQWEALRRQVADHEAIGEIAFRGDYYPLTPYDKAETVWMAWEFHSAERGEGYVQAFRRENNIAIEQRLVLRGLDPQASYELTNRDTGEVQRANGQELMDTGFTAYAAAPRTALMYTFRRVAASAPAQSK